MKLKNIIYLISFFVITSTDAILGYKTSSSFGISEKHLQIIFSLGFALMSVPLKVIYERAIEDNYRKEFGKLIFSAFSIIWITAFFLSLKGLGEYRINNIVSNEIKQLNDLVQPTNTNISTDTISTRYGYRIAKQRLLQNSKLDSIKIMQSGQLKMQLLSASMQNAKNKNSDGFLYLSLLLVLSGAICLHFGLLKDDLEEDFSPNEIITHIFDFSQKNKTNLVEDSKKNNAPKINKNSLKIDVAEDEELIYQCGDCQREFTRHGYNVHLRHHKECTKGNFNKITRKKNDNN